MVKTIVLGIVAALVVVAGVVYFMNRRQPLPIEAGVPIYPGAISNTDSFAARLSPRDRARLVKAVIYHVDGSPAPVIAFYKEKLKGKSEVLETSRHGVSSAIFKTSVNGEPKMIMITYNEDTNKSEITIGTLPGR